MLRVRTPGSALFAQQAAAKPLSGLSFLFSPLLGHGAAAGATVTSPAATITVAATAPTISAGKSVAVPAATISISGSAPSISAGKRVVVPAATITLAANAPTIQAATGVSLACPAATITVAATAPTVSAGKSISVPVASAQVLAALAPQLAAGKSIAVPTATITLTAASPVIAAGKAIAVAAASIVVGANAPVIEIVAPSGTLRVIRDAIRSAWDARWPHGTTYRVLWQVNDNESVPEPGEARAWLHIAIDYDGEDVRAFAGGREASDREWRGTVEIRVIAETGYGDDAALDLLDDAVGVYRSRREAGLSFIDGSTEIFDSATEDGAWFIRGTMLPWTYEYRA